jgi:hypothetical protein
MDIFNTDGGGFVGTGHTTVGREKHVCEHIAFGTRKIIKWLP